MMIRMRQCRLMLFCATVLLVERPGRAADPAEALKSAAEKKAAQWQALNDALEPKLAGLNACDAQVKQSISEASAASDARLDAWNRYLQSRLDGSKSTAEVRRAINFHEAERSEVEADRGELSAGSANLNVQRV